MLSASFGAFEVGLIVPRKGPLIRILQGKLEGKLFLFFQKFI